MARTDTDGTDAYREVQFELSGQAEHARIAKEGCTRLGPKVQVSLSDVASRIPVAVCIRPVVVDVERSTDIDEPGEPDRPEEVSRRRQFQVLELLLFAVVIEDSPTRKRPRVNRKISTRTDNDLPRTERLGINLVNTVGTTHKASLGKASRRKPQNQNRKKT